MDIKEIGKYIKDRRQYLKINQQELADLSGIGINTLVAVERGQGNPKLETLLAIADTLGLQFRLDLNEK